GTDLSAALGEITEAATQATDAPRAGYWACEGSQLRSVDLYERGPDRHSAGIVVQKADPGLPPGEAWLDASVRLDGTGAGVLRLEAGARRWMPDEEQFASALADLVTLCLEGRERRRAEAGWRKSEARTRAVVRASRDAIVVFDAVGRVVEFNRAAEEMFG